MKQFARSARKDAAKLGLRNQVHPVAYSGPAPASHELSWISSPLDQLLGLATPQRRKGLWSIGEGQGTDLYRVTINGELASGTHCIDYVDGNSGNVCKARKTLVALKDRHEGVALDATINRKVCIFRQTDLHLLESSFFH